MTIRAAGILFLAPGDQCLFLLRGPGGDWPGAWCFPGGTAEGDETAEDCAKREAVEELGFLPEGERVLWTRRCAVDPVAIPGSPGADPAAVQAAAPPEEVDFSVFIQRVPEKFEPKLNGEHVGHCWAPITLPPQPLHPGCQVALDRFTMNELGVARAIRDGQLTSPQQYVNLWLFAIRITGTASAFRPQHNEYVYRRPENYLTEEFLARINGLPVIVQHPDGNTLDSKEFSDRVIGTVFLPYLRGDEVWAIAKIFNERAAEAMAGVQLSTSPGVLFGPGTNTKIALEDGSKLLIEGDPLLTDHIAVVPKGVWDKGGPAAGIESIEVRKDDAMTEEERARKDAEEKAERERADAARKDAENGQKLDKLLSGLDSVMSACDALSKRMDAYEAAMPKETAADRAKKDAEEAEAKMMADKARKDAEEKAKEEEEAKKDAARKDSVELAAKLAEIDALKAAIAPRSDADRQVIANHWAATDAIMTAFGDSASHALPGEDITAYRRRLLLPLQPHSPNWKDIDLATLPADALAVAEAAIRNDAALAARNPSNVPENTLRMVTSRDATGRAITEFFGKPSAWLSPMGAASRRAMTRINTQSREH